MSSENNIKILTIGYDYRLIQAIFPNVENNSKINFAHFLYTKDYFYLKNHKLSFELYQAGNKKNKDVNDKKLDFLKKIEKDSHITINRIIMSDRVLRRRKNSDAYLYLANLADQLYKAIKNSSPMFCLGSWDGAIQGIGMLVAKHLNIPFIITKFSVIPHKFMTFCTYPNNYDELCFTKNNFEETYKIAKEARKNWILDLKSVPAYVSTRSILDVLKKIPIHLKELFNRKIQNLKYGKNEFIYYNFSELLSIYFRKKTNILFLNKKKFISDVPDYNYVFYGLHMQPESTIDVMAPFYSNQLDLIKNLSRSLPIDYKLLIKIHISDADNYSNRELNQFLNIPNVALVSPFVGSKEFIVNSCMLASIQGTIGLEGALLGKPVIMFGNSSFLKFSTVVKSNNIEELPSLVLKQLSIKKPNEKQILQDFTNLLINYLPSCDDDWSITLKNGFSDQEKINWINMYNQLTNYVQKLNLDRSKKNTLI